MTNPPARNPHPSPTPPAPESGAAGRATSKPDEFEPCTSESGTPAPGASEPGAPEVAGLVLAAGAGRRMGTPKALIRDAAGVAWVVRTSRLLAAAGCAPVVVVVGAAAETVRAELSTEPVEVVEAPDWPEGMSASLRTGLTHLQPIRTKAAVVLPVDVPGLTVAAVNRVLHRAADQPAQRSDEQVADRPVDQADEQAAGRADDRAADQVDERVAVGLGAGVLARATYGGAPGHPVVIGRAHWDGVIASAHGDEGARAYLRTHDAVLVECADIADGLDADTPEALPPGHH